MATYRQMQVYIREQYGYVPKTCWIAHVMSDHNLTQRVAPNRKSITERTNPCPYDKRAAIEETLEHFRMI